MPSAPRARLVPLTIEDVAARRNIPVDEVLQRVQAAEIKAPTRWTPGCQPRWSEQDAMTAPPDLTTVGKITMQQHMDELYDEVSNYVVAHGHARPRQQDTGRTRNGRTFPLGERVSALRTQYRRGRLAEKEASRFEQLPGWTWDKTTTEWHERFDDVLSRWPYHLTTRDRTWITVQRLRWNELGPQRQERFNEHPGMIDDAPHSKLREMREAIEEWMRLNPGKSAADVTFYDTVMLDRKEIKIGRRITYYRRRRTGKEGVNQLTPEEVRELESIPGWEWVSSRHPSRRRKTPKAD